MTDASPDQALPPPEGEPSGLFSRTLAWYRGVPLYFRILVALILGVVVGLSMGRHAEPLRWVSLVILRFLGALAPALILVAVIDAILNADIKGRSAGRMVWVLILNTVVAILIGLLVANVIRPGKHARLAPTTGPAAAAARAAAGAATAAAATANGVATVAAAAHTATTAATSAAPMKTGDIGNQLFENIPKSVLEPLVNNNVIGVVFLAVAFGVALRRLAKGNDFTVVNHFIQIAFKAVVIVLHWVIDLVPLAVLCTIAAQVGGPNGLEFFKALAWFIAAVLIALLLQVTWYLVRIRLGSWVRPVKLLSGMRDAIVMAFSTSSSTVTMPITYACLRDKVGLREDSASMGALVGSNFNNDGTALYEAMAALFIAQMTGQDLSIGQQAVVVVMAIIASVGAAGIPEAGLVTMTLVFTAVGLPVEYIPLLIPVDWFLDRCRTVINMMGDVNVSCMLEGKERTRAIILDAEPALPAASAAP